MQRTGPGEGTRVEVPLLIGMVVADARQAGHRAGLVVVSPDVDGPPLGGLTWPGIWIVTAQRPEPGTWLCRWDNVVIEFEELRGGEGAGDREPRMPPPDLDALAAEEEPPGLAGDVTVQKRHSKPGDLDTQPRAAFAWRTDPARHSVCCSWLGGRSSS